MKIAARMDSFFGFYALNQHLLMRRVLRVGISSTDLTFEVHVKIYVYSKPILKNPFGMMGLGYSSPDDRL